MLDLAALLERDPFATSLGIELVSVDPITLRMQLTDAHANFHGVTHGGAVFSLADCAFSLASNEAGEPAFAIDTHLVLPAGSKPGDTLTAVAEEVTRGRTLATYRIIVTRDDDRVVGNFTGTVYIKPTTS
ncbi:MAG: hotdog fold thioesterase [Acidimicrobiia bacterium]|nr:hotdog fold thioesterase [Acidimicrobiia bacterium]